MSDQWTRRDVHADASDILRRRRIALSNIVPPKTTDTQAASHVSSNISRPLFKVACSTAKRGPVGFTCK